MEKVLQPLNEKAARIIAEHIDLLDAQHVVPELLQLVAHVSAMRVILARWAAQQADLKCLRCRHVLIKLYGSSRCANSHCCWLHGSSQQAATWMKSGAAADQWFCSWWHA